MPSAIYVRVSTPGQADDGLGQEAQIDSCRRIATEYALVVPDEYVIVEQASGEFLERDGLDQVRSLVRTKRIDALIVYDQDRLSRNEVGTVIILDEARTAGVTVYTRSGPVDTTREGSLIAYVKGYAAALEKDKIRQRTMDGKRMAAKAGVLPVGTGAGLYGYDYTPRDRAGKRAQYRTINPAEAAVVQRMFSMALEGMGINTIARALNDEGVQGKTGKKWHPWTIKNTLRNPAYTGTTPYGRRSTKLHERGRRTVVNRDAEEAINIEGFTPAIIDQATFDRVQQHLGRPRKSGRALQPYLLTGMLKCGCGTGMVAHSMWHGKYRYYSCRGNGATATKQRSCWSKRTRMDDLDDAVTNAIKEALSDPGFLYQRVLAQLNLNHDDNVIEQATNARLKELAREERNLVAGLRSAQTAAEAITAELEKVAAERRALEKSLDTDPVGRPDTPVVKQEALTAFSERVRQRISAMSTEDMHALLSLLGFEAVVSKDRVAASIQVPTDPENYLPLHEHGHDDVNVVVVVNWLDDAGT